MGVLGNACLVLDEFPEGSSGYKIIKRIETASLRAADLTNQLLAYSGKGMFVVEPVDITKLVQEMMHLLKASISKSVILHFSSSGICPVVQADATQIRQVVMNFIINASEAIGDNTGIISVSTGTIDADRNYLNKTYFDNDLPEGVYAFLEVSDTGCGMDEKTQLRIFEPFFTTKFSGRGLGLAAAVGIIRGHNGAIKVYSVQGEGTTFRILLPVIGSPEEIPEPREEDLFEWTYGGLVLFVDDEEEVREVGKLILEKHGFSVILASDGQEAVEIFKERSSEIQAVVLDMTMPRLNGYDTFTVMKRIKPGIRVILCSGYNEQETLRVFNSMKPSGFIQKPYKASDLIRKLSSFFRHDSRLGE